MPEFLVRHFEHLLAALIFVGRVGDIASTLLVTPHMKLEMNPLARRAKRPTMALGFLMCLVPYWHTGFGVATVVVFFLVSANNLLRGWLPRALGETEYWALLLAAARRISRRVALAFVLSSALFTALVGGLLMLLSGPNAWGFWVATGILGYSGAIAFHSCVFVGRIFRAAGEAS
jgi:hypothetical protein